MFLFDRRTYNVIIIAVAYSKKTKTNKTRRIIIEHLTWFFDHNYSDFSLRFEYYDFHELLTLLDRINQEY